MTTVLVVDDSPVDRKVAGGFVEQAGFTAEFANDGAEALDQVAKKAPDMVLTDLRMPVMDGLQLVKRMRELHPGVPVILMTAYGSEQVAVDALRAGAASYVPKTYLSRDLESAMCAVRDSLREAQVSEQAQKYLLQQATHYVLGYEEGGARALVAHLQYTLERMQMCEELDLIRVGTALTEALMNAFHHGNLELDSALRERTDGAYWKEEKARMKVAPYKDRRVHVIARFTSEGATFVVRDEGPGFDYETLPDPTDPENLTKPSGRGIMLIRTFMDDVRFNERGNEITMVLSAPSRAA